MDTGTSLDVAVNVPGNAEGELILLIVAYR
jgi:hypothetical protein